MTLLTACQDVLNEIGDIEVPQTVVGNNNATARQILALANKAGDDIAREHIWQKLLTTHTFSTVNGTAAYSLPSDFDWDATQTWWDRANYWEMFGPASPQEWQTLKSGIITEGVRRWFRFQDGKIQIHPTPTTADIIAFEYISDKWCESSGGTGQSAWAADDDVFRLPEYLLKLNMAWRFLKQKGLPYDAELAEYARNLKRAIARDGSAPVLNMGARLKAGIDFDGVVNVPEAGYGT